MSYFSQSKNERDVKVAKPAANDVKLGAPSVNEGADVVSTLGHGMVINGNIVCAGSMQIYGRVTGDIHAGKVTICEGGKVTGNIIAPDAIIQGVFSGTAYANNVKLHSTAVVDGEIFNKLISIEQNALFEGVARRLDQPVSPPTSAQVNVEDAKPVPATQPAPVPAAPIAAASAAAPLAVSDFRTRLSNISDFRV